MHCTYKKNEAKNIESTYFILKGFEVGWSSLLTSFDSTFSSSSGESCNDISIK